MSGAILDVVEWWEIRTIGDDDADLTRPTRCWFVEDGEPWLTPKAECPVPDMRPNDDLEAFFAAPTVTPPKVDEGQMRRNDLLDAFFS